MFINQIVPVEIRDRICIHCDKKDEELDPTTYFIAEKGQGKTTETVHQAVFRRNPILSTEYDFFKSAGMRHFTETHEGEVSFFGLRDIFNPEFKKSFSGETLNLCVDNGKAILEELLSSELGIPVNITFLALEA